MVMVVVGFVVANRLENVFEVVREEVKSAEEKENGHGESCQDLGSFKAKRMSDAAAAPNFEIAQYIDNDTHGSATGVEEDKVRQGHCREGAAGPIEDEYGNGDMAQAPVEPHSLVSLEAFPCFLDGGRRERGGEDGGRSWGRFLKDLVLGGHATVLVAMSTTLTDVRFDRRGRYHLGLEIERIGGSSSLAAILQRIRLGSHDCVTSEFVGVLEEVQLQQR